MTIDENNTLVEKAKTRKNGVYAYRSYYYIVKDHGLIVFADYYGDIYRTIGAFNTKIGHCDNYDRQKTLKEYLKNCK